MTAVSSSTVTSTRHEWIVPAAEPWGACLGDVRDAPAMAGRAFREHHGGEQP